MSATKEQSVGIGHGEIPAEVLHQALGIAIRLSWHTRPLRDDEAVEKETEKFEAWTTEMPGVRFAAQTHIEAMELCTQLVRQAIARDLMAGRKPVKPLYDAGRATIIPVRVTAEELAQIDDEVARQRSSGRKISRSDLLRERGLDLRNEDVDALEKAWEQAKPRPGASGPG